MAVAKASNRVPHVRLTWAGGTHRFEIKPRVSLDPAAYGPHGRLPDELDQLAWLHDGEHAVLTRLLRGGWSAMDVARPIAAGLIGGEDVHGTVTADDAVPIALRIGPADQREERQRRADLRAVRALIDAHVLARPLAESIPLAQLVLMARITGVPASDADRAMNIEGAVAVQEEAA